jgi:hypothetical protein
LFGLFCWLNLNEWLNECCCCFLFWDMLSIDIYNNALFWISLPKVNLVSEWEHVSGVNMWLQYSAPLSNSSIACKIQFWYYASVKLLCKIQFWYHANVKLLWI